MYIRIEIPELDVPAPEPGVLIDYSLPLTEKAQLYTFYRIVNDFLTDTAIVDSEKKSKYRTTADKALNVRRICTLWAQVEDYVRSRVSADAFANMSKSVLTTRRLDDEWLDVLAKQPKQFIVSMLQSQRDHAHAEAVQRESAPNSTQQAV